MKPPHPVLSEFVFGEDGEVAFLGHPDRTLEETRAALGCLQAVVWTRPGRRYPFATTSTWRGRRCGRGGATASGLALGDEE